MGLYDSLIAGEPNLVYWWPCGDLSGSTAVELKAGNNGTYNPNFSLNQTGIPGSTFKSAQINVNGNIEARTFSLTSPTPPFTIECWFSSPGQSGGLMGFGNGSRTQWDRQIFMGSAGGSQNIQYGTAGGSVIIGASGVTYEDGKMHHAVAGQKANNNPFLYFDGQLVASSTDTTTPGNYGGIWYVGGVGGGPGLSWPAYNGLVGRIGHGAVYNTVLSPSTILYHYQIGAGILVPGVSSVRDPTLSRIPGIN